MDVRAIIVAGGADGEAEHMAGVPLALLDVLGRTSLERTIARLQRYKVQSITVVGEVETALGALRRATRDVNFVAVTGPMMWRHAQVAFSDQAQAGAEVVLVLRLGAYLEIDLDAFLQFHLDRATRVTAAVDSTGQPLEMFAICASRRNDAAFLLRSRLGAFRSAPVEFPVQGYCNRLRTVADVRRLAIDSFCGLTEFVPEGQQLKPGVWVQDGARIERGARLVAPCFVGAQAKIRSNAVLTRCGVVERNAVVEKGTVVEDATLLPFATVGRGLDIAHSVVGFRRIANLPRNIEIEIEDPALISATSAAPLRTLKSAASLAAFVPLQFLRGLVVRERKTVSLGEAMQSTSPALKQNVRLDEASGQEFSASELVVARRYGK